MLEKILSFIKSIFSSQINTKYNNFSRKKVVKNVIKKNKKSKIIVKNDLGDNGGK